MLQLKSNHYSEVIEQVYGIARKITYPDPSHEFDHIERVLHNAYAIQMEEGGCIDIITLSVLLHDCVPLRKDHPDSNKSATLSAQKSVEILSRFGVPDIMIQKIYHCVEAHSFSRGLKAQTLEAKIVQDADRLDSLGAIGIARVFTVAGALNRPLYHVDDPCCTQRELNDKQNALDHFYTKILQLQNRMQTKTGRALAQRRTEFVKQFLGEFKNEIAPESKALNPITSVTSFGVSLVTESDLPL